MVAKSIVLAHSSSSPYRAIFNTTTACLFFGTPFSGSRIFDLLSEYARTAEEQGNAAVHSPLLELLRPEDKELAQLRSDFSRLANAENQKISCTFFWEQRPTELSRLREMVQKLGEDKAAKIALPEDDSIMFVTDNSAILFQGKDNHGLPRNHRDVVKIDGFDDTMWTQTIQSILTNEMEKAQSRVRSRLKAVRNINSDVVKGIMDALEGGRVSKKREALLKSFALSNWISTEPQYVKWLGGEKIHNVDCLYISGPKGRGKTNAVLAAKTRGRNTMADYGQKRS